MRVLQQVFDLENMSTANLSALAAISPQLVLVFASVAHFEQPEFAAQLRAAFPDADIVGCSTAGEISPCGVRDQTASVTALHFNRPAHRVTHTELCDMADSRAAGLRLGMQVAAEGLHNVFVLGQGVGINGSALIDGLSSTLGPSVKISGGLAADGGRIQRTYVLDQHGVSTTRIVALGFCGATIEVRHGHFGGWRPFGPARVVTRADGNILYELDGERALDLYRRYLGSYARDLPASGLLFPLAMLGEDHKELGLVRTILGIDEVAGSLILAGDLIVGGYVQLMHATTDALVDGAVAAAKMAWRPTTARAALGRDDASTSEPELAILISCVGRKLIMGHRIGEEVEAVRAVFGATTEVTGFYSNGEIGPFSATAPAKLHNQTMTITTIREVDVT